MNLNNVEFQISANTEQLNNRFQAIFPTWTTVVATILSVIILLLVLTKLFYNPVKKMVNERKKFIQSNIDSAVRQNAESAKDRKQAQIAINEANTIAHNILSEAKMKAERMLKKSVEDAKIEARQLVKNAHKDAKREREIFENQAKEEMVTIALEAAKKVISKEVDNTTNKKLALDFIHQTFASKDEHDS